MLAHLHHNTSTQLQHAVKGMLDFGSLIVGSIEFLVKVESQTGSNADGVYPAHGRRYAVRIANYHRTYQIKQP